LEVARSQEFHQQVYALRLKYMNAGRAARRLAAILGKDSDATFVADEETNTVFIRASADRVRQAREIVRQIDVRTGLFIVPLKQAKAPRIAWVLNGILTWAALLGDHEQALIGADERTNSLWILAGEQKAMLINDLLQDLDGKGR
jgi:type II secretory pathway component GspD/PulD (secretin)